MINCACAVRRPSLRPGSLTPDQLSSHAAGCAAAGEGVSSPVPTLTCPSCARVTVYSRDPSTCRAFIAHVNECDGGTPPPPHLSAFAPLFRVRLHATAALACVGPPAARGGSWPSLDTSLASCTPSTRAIVVRGGPWYALSADDAALVLDDRGMRISLGSEAVARSCAGLARMGVTAIVNCAGNSAPLPQEELTASGVSSYVRLEGFADALVQALEGGGDARAESGASRLINAGADAIAVALAAAAPSDPAHVFVHCVAGVSRSASVVIAFMMKHRRMTLFDAVAHVKAARPVIMPNLAFWGVLRDIEAREGLSQHDGGSVPEEAVRLLHPHAAEGGYPISTHIFGELERS